MHPSAAQVWQGYNLMQRGDYIAARELFEQLDCDDARHQLAYIYDRGLGVPPNTEKAIQLYKQLADSKDNFLAAYNLGMLLLRIKKFSDAIHYLTIAANSHPNACYWLAQIHNGYNNTAHVNPKLYFQYLQQAARQNHYFAQRDFLILKRDTATDFWRKTAYRTRLIILKGYTLPAMFSKKWREAYF